MTLTSDLLLCASVGTVPAILRIAPHSVWVLVLVLDDGYRLPGA
jgi:hypothetical protein